MVGAVPLKITVPEFAAKIPLFAQFPLTVRVFDPMVSVAPELIVIFPQKAVPVKVG